MRLFRRREADPLVESGEALPSRLLIVRRKGVRTAFRISDQGTLVLQKEVPAQYSSALIYDQDERRMAVAKSVSYHTAYRRLRQETGMTASVVNGSKSTRAIYGIEESSASLFGGPTVPLLAALDAVLVEKQITIGARPLLAVVHFGNPGQSGCALLVIGINADRAMVTNDLAINPTETRTVLANALRSMVVAAQMTGLAWDPRQSNLNEEAKAAQEQFFRDNVVPVDGRELLGAMLPQLAYPMEPMYRGVRQSSIVKMASALSVVAALGLGATALALDRVTKSVISDTESRIAEAEARRQEVRSQLLGRAGGLSQRLTIPPSTLFAAADRVYQPGSKVRLDANLEQATVTLVMPITRSQLAPGADRRMAALARDADVVLAGLRATAPDLQWKSSLTEVSGDLNAWYMAFTTRPLDGDLLALVGLGSTSGAQQVGAIPSSPVGTAKSDAPTRFRR